MTSELAALEAFIERASGGASWRAIAEAAGLDPSTLTRQMNRGRVPVQTVVAICRAYGADMLAGFVAAGYVTTDEAVRMASGGALRSATDLELAREILRRVEETSASEVLTEPISAGSVVEGRFGNSPAARRYSLDAAALEPATPHHDEDVAFEEQP